jgi:uncharacterized SAM-binding protein YcdF (DUF218 family)
MRVSKSLLKLIAIAIIFLGMGFYIFNNKLAFAEKMLSRGQFIPDEFGTMLFVPGSGCNPGIGTQERLDLAASLYWKKERQIVISEGICPAKEQDRFRAYLKDSLGVKLKHVVWIPRGTSTEENAEDCALYCRENGIQEFILCTSSFHQARMKLYLKRENSAEFKVAEMPENLKRYNYTEPYKSRRGKMLTRELLAFLKAKLVG